MPASDADDAIARIRRFSRAVTREVGALDTSYLGRGRPLGTARVLHLVTAKGSDVADIRAALDLDSGLMSRMLRGLEDEGLIRTRADPVDRRRRVAQLTSAGSDELAEYNRLATARAEAILARAPRHAEALLQAMDLIATTLDQNHITIEPDDPDTPEAQACLAAYFQLLCDKIPAFTPDHFPLPVPDADDYRLPNGVFLMARSDGAPLGCVSLHGLEPGLGEVKRLWVAPMARGQGLARRLMAAIEDRARAFGHRRLILETNGVLGDAVALYRSSGWQDTAPYTEFPATHWFTKPL